MLAEASASGLPCIVYRAGGTSDVVRDGITGLLTDPREDAFCAAVRGLLRNPEGRIAMGYAAREHALNALGWEPAVSALRDLSNRLIAKTVARHRVAGAEHDRLK